MFSLHDVVTYFSWSVCEIAIGVAYATVSSYGQVRKRPPLLGVCSVLVVDVPSALYFLSFSSFFFNLFPFSFLLFLSFFWGGCITIIHPCRKTHWALLLHYYEECLKRSNLQR